MTQRVAIMILVLLVIGPPCLLCPKSLSIGKQQRIHQDIEKKKLKLSIFIVQVAWGKG